MQTRWFLGALAATLCLVVSPVVHAEAPTLDLSAYEGKVVVLDFWASWCVPCRRSFPWLNAMREKYGDDGLVIIGVNVDRDRSEAERFLAEYPAEFTIFYDTEGRYASEYGVEAMPSSYVFGRDGELRVRHLGFKVQKQDEYEAALAAALQEGSN